MDSKKEITEFLDSHGIKYVAFSHPVTDTLPEKLENDRKAGVFGATHCKNLLLASRSRTRFYLLTVPFGKKFRTGPDSRKMGSGRLNFATDDDLSRLLHTVSGMVSPLELIFDVGKEVTFAVDRDLISAERICFHPSDDTVTFVFENEEFFGKFLPAAGITYSVIVKDEKEDYLE